MSGDNSQGEGGAGKAGDEISKLKEKYESENFKLREQLRSEKTLREQDASEKRRLEEEALKGSKNHEELSNRYKAELETERSLRIKREADLNEGKKNDRIALELSKLGLRPELRDKALNLVNRGRVFLDETTGTIIGAEEVAKEFAVESAKFQMGFFKETTLNVNHGSTKNGKISNNTQGMTHAERMAYWEKKQNENSGG